ncbi:helix-turn-helix domain-containing protein [Burkholderia sp. B21-007]|uniref:helix-turn-helix domain-containing protein n=1 Tax=Burkholderia sp. B21-007 TaxID=2890407 RepID=UPI001E4ECC5E|nr:hypothetical protein [Burkholderia sp. B21-007]UEP31576.1 hypothetical protein LMA01_20425 [Burkholderia sp. B21-007]
MKLGELLKSRREALGMTLDDVADALTELRRIVHELRTYNPAADEYKGAHIHKVWAREIEALIAVEQHEAAPALTYEVVEKLARKIGLHIEAFDHTEGNDLLDFARACVKAAPLEGTGNGADERAAQVADYLNAPGMWAQVYCCAVFVRGWPSDMARSAADEAVKEFGDAACKTVADLTNTLDEVLRVD